MTSTPNGKFSLISYSSNTYVGWRSIYTNIALPKNKDFYFETLIMNKGHGNNNWWEMVIGVAKAENVRNEKVSAKFHAGYHTFDGKFNIFKNDVQNNYMNSIIASEVGDYIGCEVLPTENKVRWFISKYHNGAKPYHEEIINGLSATDFYAVIGMVKLGQAVKVNFGSEPFVLRL